MADPASPAIRGDAMPPWIPRAILWFFGTGLAIFVAWWLVVRLRGLLVMLLVALFLSFALEPAVNWMAERGWRRGAATLTVMFVLLIAGAMFVWAMGASWSTRSRTSSTRPRATSRTPRTGSTTPSTPTSTSRT